MKSVVFGIIATMVFTICVADICKAAPENRFLGISMFLGGSAAAFWLVAAVSARGE